MTQHSTEGETHSNRFHAFPLVGLLPNLITLSGLCIGLFGLKHALAGKWEMAVTCIIISAFIDGLDGRMARILNASSNFGAHLDSLTDFFNFSVAPAIILYTWKGNEIHGVGWAIALLFIICGALRLARFNVGLEDAQHDRFQAAVQERFFAGIPAPVAASLSLAPMMIAFYMKQRFPEVEFALSPVVLIAYMALVAMMMVSRIPTISIKKMSISRDYASVCLAIAALIIAAMILEPWIVFPIIGIFYLLSIPYSMFRYWQFKADWVDRSLES